MAGVHYVNHEYDFRMMDDTKFCYQSGRLFFYLNHKKFWEFFGSSERKPFKRDDAYCPVT